MHMWPTILGCEYKKGSCLLNLGVKRCLQMSLTMCLSILSSTTQRHAVSLCPATNILLVTANDYRLLSNKHSQEQSTWSCSSCQHPPWATFESVCNWHNKAINARLLRKVHMPEALFLCCDGCCAAYASNGNAANILMLSKLLPCPAGTVRSMFTTRLTKTANNTA